MHGTLHLHLQARLVRVSVVPGHGVLPDCFHERVSVKIMTNVVAKNYLDLCINGNPVKEIFVSTTKYSFSSCKSEQKSRVQFN